MRGGLVVEGSLTVSLLERNLVRKRVGAASGEQRRL